MSEFIRISRFVRTGLLAAGSEYLAFILFLGLFSATGATARLLLANGLSFIIGFVISLSLSRKWTFNSSNNYRLSLKIQIILYATLAISNLFASSLLIHGLENTGINVLFCKLISMAIIASWNYAIMRWFVFSERPKRKTVS